MNYPKHWWTPVATEGAPEWEIFPQAAGPGEVILSKRHELGLLSNFAPTPFVFRGKKYPGVEGLWQSLLYPEGPNDERARFQGLTWKHKREDVAQMGGHESKAAGDLAYDNMVKMKINWVTFEGRKMAYDNPGKGDHYHLIHSILWEKLRQNPNVEEVLRATAGLRLLPDHHQEKDSPPAWLYNVIWMEIREVLLNEKIH